MGNVGREMPKYRCHKVVHALKIASVSGSLITPVEDGYAAFDVPMEFIRKHEPEAGGYYVVYEDGYASFSPAAAFESGYTAI